MEPKPSKRRSKIIKNGGFGGSVGGRGGSGSHFGALGPPGQKKREKVTWRTPPQGPIWESILAPVRSKVTHKRTKTLKITEKAWFCTAPLFFTFFGSPRARHGRGSYAIGSRRRSRNTLLRFLCWPEKTSQKEHLWAPVWRPFEAKMKQNGIQRIHVASKIDFWRVRKLIQKKHEKRSREFTQADPLWSP